MKIAIPTEHNRLHGHFGGCQEFTLVEADQQARTIVRSETIAPPEHKPGAFPRWLREKGVQVVIVCGIGQRALDIFSLHGIQVVAGQPGSPVEALVLAYLSGSLTGKPEGCTSHGHDHHHHHDHEHGDGHGNGCNR